MVYSNGPSIVRDGLVLHLDAADRNSYPRSGTTWYDLSGNNNHFTLVSSVFDNTNKGSLSYGNNIRIYKTNGIWSSDNNNTVMSFFYGNFWFAETTSAAGNTKNGILSSYASAARDQYPPGGVGSRLDLSFSYNSGNKILAHRIASDRAATWFYNGFFSSGGTSETYDGITPEITEIGNRTIGENSNYYGGSFAGKLGAFLCYNTALTDDQILQNYNALKGRFGL